MEKKNSLLGCLDAKAFTLIELLVVVLIIGILAAIALPQYQKSVEKARFTEAISLVRSFAQAEKVYHLANGVYTDKLDELDIAFPGTYASSATVYLGKNFTIHTYGLSNENAHIQAHSLIENSGWTVTYYLNKGSMVCAASSDNARGTQFCKSVATGPSYSCGLTCYPL